MRNTFVLRMNYAPIIEQFTNAQAGQLFKAIFTYVEIGAQQPVQDPAVATALKFIAKDIEYDIVKYEETCARRAESGRLGGLKTQENRRNGL